MTKKSFTLVSLGMVILLFTTGCRGRDCIGFPEHLADYFPYQKDDVLRFANPQNDTLIFHIQYLYKTQAENYPPCAKCACRPFFEFYTSFGMDSAGNMKDSFYIRGEILPIKGQSSISCIFNNVWDIDRGSDNFSKMESTSDPFDPNNGTMFGNTVMLSNENADRFNQVTVVKGIGITEFFDTGRNCLWKKIN